MADEEEFNPYDPDNPPQDVLSWLRAEMAKMIEEELARQPWWCMCCGDGGNYTGERPDWFWYPPVDHVCRETYGEPQGIETVLDFTHSDIRLGDERNN